MIVFCYIGCTTEYIILFTSYSEQDLAHTKEVHDSSARIGRRLPLSRFSSLINRDRLRIMMLQEIESEIRHNMLLRQTIPFLRNMLLSYSEPAMEIARNKTPAPRVWSLGISSHGAFDRSR